MMRSHCLSQVGIQFFENSLIFAEHQKTSSEMTESELEAEKMQLYQEILKLKQDIESSGQGNENLHGSAEIEDDTVDD